MNPKPELKQAPEPKQAIDAASAPGRPEIARETEMAVSANRLELLQIADAGVTQKDIDK